jgi:hypothetical protein
VANTVKTKQHRRKELVVMSAPYIFKAVRSNPESAGASIQVELIMKSELAALLPVVEELMHFVRKSDCIPGQERDVELALRAALNNACFTATARTPGNKFTSAAGVDQVRKYPSSSRMKDKALTRLPFCTRPSWRVRNPTISEEFS